MGSQVSKDYHSLDKHVAKLQERIINMETNMKRLVTIVNNLPGPSLDVEHLHVKKSIILQNNDSEEYLYLSFDDTTNQLKMDKNISCTDTSKCMIM
jgi:hypothetical protein